MSLSQSLRRLFSTAKLITLGLGLLLSSASAQSTNPSFALGEVPPAPGARSPYATRTVTASSDLAAATALPAGLSISPTTRDAARVFYFRYYLPSESAAINWTGSLTGEPATTANGVPGTTGPAFRSAILQRINWFRAMAGLPANVTFRDAYSAQDQDAALMMTANNALDHSPPRSWLLYTDDGALAAQNSNLALGWTGPAAIDAYMLDYGASNYALGHRRWMLYPQTREMGSGDIPWMGDFYAANAVWVVDDNYYAARPTTRDGFVAWPPPGFVPSTTIYPRWSFAYPGANFSNATVTMTSEGQSVPVAQEDLENPSYGENTLAWVWKGINAAKVYTVEPPPTHDTAYLVRINNVIIAGKTRNFTYTVTVFDPEVGDAVYQPDLSIADWGQKNWQGSHVYSPVTFVSAAKTTASTKMLRKFKIKLRNDGTHADTFAMLASAAATGFTVQYLDGPIDVTQAMVAGTYEIKLPFGGMRIFTARVKCSKKAASGAQQTVSMQAVSVKDSTKTDRVKVTVTAP